MTVHTAYVSPIEFIWIVTVVTGILMNTAFVMHSERLVRHVKRHNLPPSMREAAAMRRFVDTMMMTCQLLFVPPGMIAARHPNPPMTTEGWVFTGCFIGVEVLLVATAAVSAAWVRRIVRYRLLEQRS
jgi:hypothetical protein